MRAIPNRWYVAVQTALAILVIVAGPMAIAALSNGRWLAAALLLGSVALVAVTSTQAQNQRVVRPLWPALACVTLVLGLVVIGIEPMRPTPWPMIATTINSVLRRR